MVILHVQSPFYMQNNQNKHVVCSFSSEHESEEWAVLRDLLFFGLCSVETLKFEIQLLKVDKNHAWCPKKK